MTKNAPFSLDGLVPTKVAAQGLFKSLNTKYVPY